MNSLKYKWILYFIAAVILGTITIQIYWNYKNYQINKRQLINEVQACLDQAVENYYTGLIKNSALDLTLYTTLTDSLQNTNHDNHFHRLNIPNNTDTIGVKIDDGIKVLNFRENESIIKKIRNRRKDTIITKLDGVIHGFNRDSLIFSNFRTLTSRVMISLTQDSLRLEALDSLFNEQLQLKEIDIDYSLEYPIINNDSTYIDKDKTAPAALNVLSSSPYLNFDRSLYISFSNPFLIVLNRMLWGLLISFLLVLGVVACLFYLLRIINYQKQLAEVKNDLISNITHEFKTPISTIGVALESIQNFDVLSDKEKTNAYLDMSSQQLSKLNVMVEKLLETATLDSNNLELEREDYDLVSLVNLLVEKHKLTLEDKTLVFKTNVERSINHIDAFHFENAINNVIDNAIKYGGNQIEVEVEQKPEWITISISDNGQTLNKASKERIFEKFYRVPKGNTHDIKGFGIGLYYAKTIIEKHGGNIILNLDDNRTTFKISLSR